MLEEYITVLMRTAHSGLLRVQSVLAECLNSVHIAHLSEILVVPLLDLLNFV